MIRTASFAALATGGALDRSLPHQYLMMLVPLLAGVGIGVACFHVVSTRAATQAVLILVTVSGLAMLIA